MSNEKGQHDDHPHRVKRAVIGLSPMTVNVRICTLKAFFNWCEREGHVAVSSARDIKLQKVDNDTVVGSTSEQVKRLLGGVDQRIYAGLRD